jgi:hypothetical protein
MNKTIPLLGCASLLAVLACGGQIVLADRSCPCQAGWTCCPGSTVCVPPGEPWQTSCLPTLCPKGILSLPNQSHVASAYAKGFLSTGTMLPFDYAETDWLTMNGGISESGWVFEAASKNDSFTFTIYADVDGGDTPLQVDVFGPLQDIDNPDGGTCEIGPANGNAPIASGVTWSAPSPGLYLILPYHAFTFSPDGTPEIDKAGDRTYSKAFLGMTQLRAAP